MNTSRKIILTSAIGLSLILSACSGGGGGGAGVKAVHEKTSYFTQYPDASDSEVQDAIVKACDALKSGVSIQDIAASVTSSAPTQDEGYAMANALDVGMQVECPDEYAAA